MIDRHTENNIKGRRSDLQKEASELTTYLKQNQDVTQTLMNICQRYDNMFHFYEVYNKSHVFPSIPLNMTLRRDT